MPWCENLSMARQPLTRRLLVGAAAAALIAGALVVALVLRGPSQEVAQPSVVPHLVPDVGGLHSGSQTRSSAPKVTTVNPGIRLIPSAGGHRERIRWCAKRGDLPSRPDEGVARVRRLLG